MIIVGAAFSFDWGLIQPEISNFTHVCTYDSAGAAWSDPPDKATAPSCDDRVSEIHRLLQTADVQPANVLVGYSFGGLVARLYAHRYPADIVGTVLVDHAFIDVGSDARDSHPVTKNSRADSLDSPPVLISSSPIELGLEDDQNFQRLPEQDRVLHRWAVSQHPLNLTPAMAAECSMVLQQSGASQDFALGDLPLIVIRTKNDAPGYAELQAKLLRLSRNSAGLVAGSSSHLVIIDKPDIVARAIRRDIDAVRSHAALTP